MGKRPYLKAILLITSTLTVMAGATIAPSLPQMAEVFADTPNAEFLSKLILTIPALFIAATAPFAGWLTDMFGRKKLLLFALILYAMGGASGLYLNGLIEILVGRAFLGLAVAAIMTISTTLAGDYFEGEERKAFLGTQSAFMALGGMVYVTLGGVLADIHWRAPFILYLAPLILWPFAYKVLFEPDTSHQVAGEATADFTRHQKKTILFIYIIAFLGMLSFYMVPVQLPFLLKQSFNVSNTLVGLAITASTATGALMGLNYRRIRVLFGYTDLFGIAFFLVAVGFGVVFWADSYIFIVLAMLINGMGVGLMMPNASLWLISIAPTRVRGRIIGGVTTAFFLGQFLSPVYVSFISSSDALGISFAITALGLLAGVAFIFLIGKKLEATTK